MKNRTIGSLMLPREQSYVPMLVYKTEEEAKQASERTIGRIKRNATKQTAANIVLTPTSKLK